MRVSPQQYANVHEGAEVGCDPGCLLEQRTGWGIQIHHGAGFEYGKPHSGIWEEPQALPPVQSQMVMVA